jgi:hypothetical protein
VTVLMIRIDAVLDVPAGRRRRGAPEIGLCSPLFRSRGE